MCTFAYCGAGNFVPLKHYDPVDEEELLKKYCPKMAKEKKKKVVGGRAKKVVKVKGKPTPTPGDDPQPIPTPKSPVKKAKSPR